MEYLKTAYNIELINTMESLGGTHVLVETCDAKTVTGELTVPREGGRDAVRMPWIRAVVQGCPGCRVSTERSS